MAHHEKIAEDEVFLGNTQRDGDTWLWLKDKRFETLRLGEVAFDIDGERLPDSYNMAPLIINRREFDRYDDMMMERTFGPNWRR